MSELANIPRKERGLVTVNTANPQVANSARCISLAECRTFLGDLEDWELEARVDDGRLAFVFNVASASADTRREMRVPLGCVKDCQDGTREDWSAAQLVNYLFGPGHGPIRARRVYRALGIKHGHFYALVRSGALVVSPGRRGPGGGALVTRAALVSFLEQRRIL